MVPKHGFHRALRLAAARTARFPQSRAFTHGHSLTSQTSSNLPSNNPPSALPTTIRHLMRSLPHPLTVILSASPTPHGLLVSSFNTITLHPTPYVSFNIKLPSATYDAICSSGSFTANALFDPAVARAFAEGEAWMGKGFVSEQGRLRRGGMWWMKCVWEEGRCVNVGDHVVVVGRVVEAGEYEGGRGRVGVVWVGGGVMGVEGEGEEGKESWFIPE